MLHPALPGAPRVQCLIRRHRSGLGFYPTYRMYLTRRRQGPLQVTHTLTPGPGPGPGPPPAPLNAQLTFPPYPRPLQRDGPTKKPEERGEVFLLAARRRSGVVSGGHSLLILRLTLTLALTTTPTLS